MSLQPVLWALKSAPVKDVEEFAILSVMAEAADEDGCNSFQSQATIGKRTKLAVRTVQRRVEEMESRGLIRLGDQAAAAYIPEHVRPVVWDLMIPLSWFPDLAETQDWRSKRGRPPLTPRGRPDLGPAPAAKRRADLGKRRLQAVADDDGNGEAPPTATPDYKTGGDSQTGDVYKSPGDYKTGTPRLVDQDPPSTSRTNNPFNKPQRPTPPVDAFASTDQTTLDVDCGTVLDPEADERRATQLLVGAYAEAWRAGGGHPTQAVRDACGRNVKRLRSKDHIELPVLLLAVQRAGGARSRDLDRHLGEALKAYDRASTREAMFRAWQENAARLDGTKIGA